MMIVNKETQTFIDNSPTKSIELLSGIVDVFLAEGCHSYVKTIYIGFEIDGEMVAALYPFAKHVEIALALDEEHVDPRLKDATHLTWKTLPVLLELSSITAVRKSVTLFREACERVRTSKHQVMRDNEFFMSAKTRRQERHRRSR